MVEVCAVVYEPNVTECPIQFPFQVMFTTADNTAGKTKLDVNTDPLVVPLSAVATTDYSTVSTILQFSACQRRVCVNITIQSDGVPEQTESFFVTLERTPGLDSKVTLDPLDGEIEINGIYIV